MYNVFISWSGERSEKVALALREWLPMVLQAVRPWMSKEDIETGSRGLEEIGKALEAMSIGIICLTPENAEKPWIHFEAGALSKIMSENARVCPYAFGDLGVGQVKLPLGIFQATKADKDGTRRLVVAVNRALGGTVAEDSVMKWFEREWTALEKKLGAIQAPKAIAAPERGEKEMFAQILDLIQMGALNNARTMDEIRSLREILARLETRYTPFQSAFSEGAWGNVYAPAVTGGIITGTPVITARSLAPGWGESTILTTGTIDAGPRLSVAPVVAAVDDKKTDDKPK
jgi:hypothetical protein